MLNPFTVAWRSLPYIIAGGILGLIVYNPSGYSVLHGTKEVLFNGVGYVESLEWYYQPLVWVVTLGLMMLVGVFWFNWQIARSELTFLVVFLAAIAVLNALVLSSYMAIYGVNPFSFAWVKWQVAPVIGMALVFGARLPHIRRAYSGTMTGGGGEIEVENIDHANF